MIIETAMLPDLEVFLLVLIFVILACTIPRMYKDLCKKEGFDKNLMLVLVYDKSFAYFKENIDVFNSFAAMHPEIKINKLDRASLFSGPYYHPGPGNEGVPSVILVDATTNFVLGTMDGRITLERLVQFTL